MSRAIITIKKVIELLYNLDGNFQGKLTITYDKGGVIVGCKKEHELFK